MTHQLALEKYFTKPAPTSGLRGLAANIINKGALKKPIFHICLTSYINQLMKFNPFHNIFLDWSDIILSIVQGKSKRWLFMTLVDSAHYNVAGEFSIKSILSTLISGKNPFIIS